MLQETEHKHSGIYYLIMGEGSRAGARGWAGKRERGTQLAREDKNEKGVEGRNGELKEQRWRVHVCLGDEGGHWSIPGFAFPDTMIGKGQRVSFPMKEGLSGSDHPFFFLQVQRGKNIHRHTHT